MEYAARKLIATALLTVAISVSSVSAEEASPAASAEKATALAPIEISGEVEVEYKISNTFTGTKMDTPIIETPVSIQVVPSTVIEDRNVNRLQEALESVSGVVPVPTLGVGSRYIIRGFRQDRIYRDGLQSNGLNAAFPTEYDTATVESVEVVKGPASVLYGRIEPGGLINITTKKPLAVSQHSVDAQVGSFNSYRADGDTTGAIDKDGKWLYRVIASGQKSDTFKDFGKDDRIVLAPSVTWKPSAATDLRLSLENYKQDYQSDYGIPVIGDRPADLPRERSFNDPNDPLDNINRFQVGTELNHHINADWTLRHRFLYGQLKNDSSFVNPTPAFGEAIQADGVTMNRNIFWQSADSDNYTTNLDVVGDVAFGVTKHKVILGADYLQGRTHYYTGGDWKNADPDMAIDIYNPTYGIDPAKFADVYQTYSNHSVFKDYVRGFYLQDQVKVGESVQLLIGGRYDWAETGRGASTANESEAAAAVPSRKDEAFSPRLAALYQIQPDLSTYVSWSRSFGANNGISATGGTFEPQKGEQYEVGVKAEFFERRLLTNIVAYHLTKSNLLTADLSTEDPSDSIAVGEQRAQGVEIDISGQVTDQTSLIASYAYTDGIVSKDNNGLEGKRINNVPQHALSLWGRYDFPFGLNVGLGGQVVGDRPGDLPNTFTLAQYTRIDAMASYGFKLGGQALVAKLNVRNLMDTYYYESSDPNLNVAPRLGVAVGDPRTLTASIKMEF